MYVLFGLNHIHFVFFFLFFTYFLIICICCEINILNFDLLKETCVIYGIRVGNMFNLKPLMIWVNKWLKNLVESILSFHLIKLIKLVVKLISAYISQCYPTKSESRATNCIACLIRLSMLNFIFLDKENKKC